MNVATGNDDECDYDDDFDVEEQESPSTTHGAHMRPSASYGEVNVNPGNGRLGKHSKKKDHKKKSSKQQQLAPDAEDSATNVNETVVDIEKSKKIERLKSENVSLRRELLEMNRKLDTHLMQKGLDLPAPIAAPRQGAMLPQQKLQLQIEHRRKMNADLRHQISIATTPLEGPGAELDDVRKITAELKLRLDTLRGENRGLENVFAHQRSKLTVDEKRDRELQERRREHTDRVRGIKEQLREARAQRDNESNLFQKHIRSVSRLEERIRLYEELGADWTGGTGTTTTAETLVEMADEKVQQQEDALAELERELSKVCKRTAVESKRQRHKERQQRELRDLHHELQELQHGGGPGPKAQFNTAN